MTPTFGGKHPSMLEALRAYGVDDAQARALVEDARRNRSRAIRLASAPSLAGGGDKLARLVASAFGRQPTAVRVVIRRMPGNQVEAWELPLQAAPAP